MIKYFEKQLEIFGDSLRSMDGEVFEKLLSESVDTLRSGHKVIVSGLGKNVPVCEKFVGSMQSLGLESYYLNTNSAVHGDMGVVKGGDLVIILTKSGETAESVYLARLLKERNICLWLISFVRESTLTKEIPSHLILDIEHEGDPWNIMPNNSTIVNLIVLQGLVMRIAEEMKIPIEDFKKNHPGGAIGEILRG